MSLAQRRPSQEEDEGGAAAAAAVAPEQPETTTETSAAVVSAHSPPREDGDADAGPEPELFPTLGTLEAAAAGRENTLENLAQHAVELHDSSAMEGGLGDMGLAGFHEDGSFFTATGEARFGMLDEGAGAVPGAGNGAAGGNGSQGGHGKRDDGGAGPNDEFAFDESLDASAVAAAAVADGAVHPGHEHENEHDLAKMGGARGVPRGNKRRREDDEAGDMVNVGPVENGEPIDPIKLKKDSHKEVERRRRENINEGIMEIVRQVPGGSDPKVGKGILLKRARDYLLDLKAKVESFSEDMGAKDREKQDVQTELDHLRTRLDQAQADSIKWETAWREAEDRSAQSQFEINRLKTELEDAKKHIEELEAK